MADEDENKFIARKPGKQLCAFDQSLEYLVDEAEEVHNIIKPFNSFSKSHEHNLVAAFYYFNLSDTYSKATRLEMANMIAALKLLRRKDIVQQEPPKKAIKLMHFFIAKDNREALIGDILEDYPDQVKNLESEGLAKLWVWKECTFIVGNAFLDWFIRKYEAIKGLIKLGGGS